MTSGNAVSLTRESSSSPSKHRSSSMFSRALSSLSKPVEDWGISDVPVLSVQVTPRRPRASPGRSPEGGISGGSGPDGSPRGAREKVRDGAMGGRKRVSALRPLSVASVSTFGSWMLDAHPKEEEKSSSHAEGSAELGSSALGDDESVSSHDRTAHGALEQDDQQPPLSLRSQGSETNTWSRRGLLHAYNPLRMHPPSPVLSPSLVACRSLALPVQGSSLPAPMSASLHSPSSSSFSDRASKLSRETIGTRRSRATLAEVDIETANADATPHDEATMQASEGTSIPGQMAQAATCEPFPRDQGYVEAMRLWYEEKENEALKGAVRKHKRAKRSGTAGGALASISANRRL